MVAEQEIFSGNRVYLEAVCLAASVHPNNPVMFADMHGACVERR